MSVIAKETGKHYFLKFKEYFLIKFKIIQWHSGVFLLFNCVKIMSLKDQTFSAGYKNQILL